MESHERRLVLDQLIASEARLLELVDGLTAARWSFHETPERWSISENIEHLVVFENFILEKIREALEQPSDAKRTPGVSGKDSLVLDLSRTRGVKFKAREVARPTGKWPDTAELIAEFRKTRARSLAFASEVFATKGQAALRNHFFPHIVFGDLDCYQWLVLLASTAFGTHFKLRKSKPIRHIPPEANGRVVR